MEVNLISGTLGRSWWKGNRNDFTGMHSFPNWRVSKIIMTVKLSQSRHKFRDAVQPLVTQHSTCPQGVTEWFYFSISLNISLSFCGIKVIHRMLSQAITTTRSDQLQWNTFLKHSAFPACAKDYLSTWLASLSGMQTRLHSPLEINNQLVHVSTKESLCFPLSARLWNSKTVRYVSFIERSRSCTTDVAQFHWTRACAIVG